MEIKPVDNVYFGAHLPQKKKDKMILFRYEHAARNWVHQQKKWFGRKTKIVELKSETPEGARWGVKEI